MERKGKLTAIAVPDMQARPPSSDGLSSARFYLTMRAATRVITAPTSEVKSIHFHPRLLEKSILTEKRSISFVPASRGAPGHRLSGHDTVVPSQAAGHQIRKAHFQAARCRVLGPCPADACSRNFKLYTYADILTLHLHHLFDSTDLRKQERSTCTASGRPLYNLAGEHKL